MSEETTVVQFDPGLYDTSVKAISEDGYRVGGYAVVFGNPAQKDLTGEYFTKSTNFELNWFDQRPVLYHHGLDTMVKTTPIGVIDTVKVDDVGVWAEAQLNKHNRYVGKVKELVAKGALGWSSGSMSHLVTKADDGAITRWPLIEASLTPTPAEPRNTWVTHVAGKSDTELVLLAYKALNIPAEKLEPPQETATDGAKDSAPVSSEAVETAVPPIPNPEIKTIEEEPRMGFTSEELATIADAVAAKMIAATPVKTAPAAAPLPVEQTPATPAVKTQITVGEDRAHANLTSEEMLFKAQWMRNLVETGAGSNAPLVQYARKFVAEIDADPDGKYGRAAAAKAFRENKRGQTANEVVDILPFKSLEDAERGAYKANEVSNDGQSGFGSQWVWQSWSQQAWLRIRIANPMTQIIPSFEMPSNSFVMPIESTDPTIYYVPETTDATSLVYNASNTISLSKPGTSNVTFAAVKLAGRLAYSMEISEDAVNVLVPRYTYQLKRAGYNAVDNTIINGDTATSANTNINLIDGTPATAPTVPNYIAFDGILKSSLVTTTSQSINANGASPTLKLMRQLRSTLKQEYSVDIPNLAYVVDVATYFAMLSMPEYLTWQNANNNATALTGVLPGGAASQIGDQAAIPVGLIDNIPVYVSAEMALANSSGKVPSGGGTLGRAFIIHKTRYMLGYRRHFDFQSASLPLLSDVNIMQLTVRCILKQFDTKSTASLYNILV